MAMTHKEHIVNLLKEVHRGPNRGEDVKAYFDRMADSILGYIPEEDKPKKFFRKQEEKE